MVAKEEERSFGMLVCREIVWVREGFWAGDGAGLGWLFGGRITVP